MDIQKKIKLGFLFHGNPTDTKYWSGTVSRLHSNLEKSEMIELVDLVVTPHLLSRYVKKVVRTLSSNRNVLSNITAFLDSAKTNKIIEKSDCDWIFAPAGSRLIYAGRNSLRNKKLIYLSDATYHKMIGYYYNHSEHDQKIGNAWEKEAHKLAHTVILPAEWSVEDAVSYYGTPKDKIRIIKFGANLDDYGYKYFESGKTTYKLLLVGVDYVRKGVDVAIETVKLLNESSTSTRFELSVVGLNKPDIDIPDYVTFYGKLRKSNENELKKLVDIYLNHDIFILPTRAECSAIVFGEASMFGLPVFSYRTGGTADYVEDRVSGRCLDPKRGAAEFCSAILEALENGDMEKFSINARKKYEDELNWDRWLEQFETILK